MHPVRTTTLCLVAALGSLPAQTQAQDGKNTFGGDLFGGSTTDQAETTFGDSRDVVGTEFVPMRESAPPGTVVPIAVVFDIEDTWHIWTNEGGVPEGVTVFEDAIWTEIDAESDGTLDFEITWPDSHVAEVDLGMGAEEYAVFEGRSVAFVNVMIPADAAPGTTTITITASFQACDDATCLMPTFDPPLATISLTIDPGQPMLGESTGLFTGWVRPETAASTEAVATETGSRRSTDRSNRGGRSGKTAPEEPTEPPATPTPTPAEPVSPTPEPAVEPSAGSTGSSFFGITIPKTDGGLGLVLLILMAIAGGFILNLTPCVLPVIPIKIMTISQHAGTPGRALSLGLWMAFGVFAFWLLIGLPVAFLTTFTDPSVIFGIWWVTLGIGLLIGLMGIGIMGLFTLQLPQSVYMVNPKADNAGGSFLFGVMTAVLGLPCFGFVAGALLAGTATLPPWITLVIFGSIGVGMALPYLVLSARPSLVEKIPRTGPASELVKQVMGLLLLAAAAYFVGAGLIGLTAEMPWMGKQIHWWAIACAMIVAGGWLTIRTFQITPRPGARILWALVAIVFAFIPTWFAIHSSEKAHATWLELAELRGGDSSTFSTKVWNPYTPERLEAARAEGKIVIVDFTAEWCLNCKAMKAAVLDVNPVKSRLAEDSDIVTLTADNTSRNAPGWTLMEELGQTGIPLLAIWGPDDELLSPWQSNAYTASQVLKAIEERE